ncbi:MAG: hypothetical protein V1743_02300 [Nanoarchaeota archaeon]
MTKVFDQFRKSDEEQSTTSHVSEEHVYIITKPGKGKEIRVEHSVQDCVDGEGYIKRIKAVALECGCCGMLSSFSPDIRYKPPAGRCQNPDCRVLLCQKHLEESHSCSVCGKPLCPACLRRTRKDAGLLYCYEHFKEFAEENHLQEIRNNSIKKLRDLTGVS